MKHKKENTTVEPVEKEVTENTERKVEELEQRVTALEEEVKQALDAKLRACAEMENFKKRKEQEKNDFCRFANEEILKELLPIIDSFEYAISHAKATDKHEEEIVQGFVLIQKQLQNLLAKTGVKEIEALNKIFDPNIHQAVQQEETEGVEVNTVVKELQKGYLLNDRVLRPSMVIVSK